MTTAFSIAAILFLGVAAVYFIISCVGFALEERDHKGHMMVMGSFLFSATMVLIAGAILAIT